MHRNERILVIDTCPQANLSEVLLGGLVGSGSTNLLALHGMPTRRSIGGYFQQRLPQPYTTPAIDANEYLSHPHTYNHRIPDNINLLAGDPLLELQGNAMATLANNQIPGTDTWLKVIDWLRDFLAIAGNFNHVFIDCNPSFSLYTQIALSTADFLVLPVMADDSSKRALQNAFSLVHGLNLPSPIYSGHAFATKLTAAGRTIPLIHLIIKNRITQYMGGASAYAAVLGTIDGDVDALLQTHPQIFSFASLADGTIDMRDFQTTGVVSFAEGTPFFALSSGRHNVGGTPTQIKQEYLDNCLGETVALANRL
jgi:cellulose biosynthesis protein BcsQ